MRTVNISKKQIMTIASECGLKSVKSRANFVAVDCGRDASYAKSVLQGLVKQRIFVRMPFFSPQSRCIRISVGKPSDLKRLEKIFPKVLNEVNASKSF